MVPTKHQEVGLISFTQRMLMMFFLNVLLDESRFIAGCITGMGAYVSILQMLNVLLDLFNYSPNDSEQGYLRGMNFIFK